MPRWAIRGLVTAARGLGAVWVLAVAPLAPFLLVALHLTRAQVGWFLPAVYLGGVLMSLPAVWLTDRLRVAPAREPCHREVGGRVILAGLGANFATGSSWPLFAGLASPAPHATSGPAPA